MYKMTKIEVTRGEGPIEGTRFPVGKTFTLTTWREANQILEGIAADKKADNDLDCYDKTDFKVYWEDGETYEGRADVKADGDDTDLVRHIVELAMFYKGDAKPAHMSDYDYNRMIAEYEKDGTSESYRYFLKTYQIGDILESQSTEGITMKQELESLGLRPEIAEGLEAIAKVQLNGKLPDDTVEALKCFSGWLLSLATTLEEQRRAPIPQDYGQLGIAADENTLLYEMEETDDLRAMEQTADEVQAAQSLEEMTDIPAQFDRRESQETPEECYICGETESPYFADGLCKDCHDSTQDNASDDIDGGTPAILVPPPPVNPRGPAPAAMADEESVQF